MAPKVQRDLRAFVRREYSRGAWLIAGIVVVSLMIGLALLLHTALRPLIG